MRNLVSLLALAALGAYLPSPKLHAQALSPDKPIDEVDVVTVIAVVDKIDLEKRKVTLTLDDGKTKTYKVDKAAVNLDQVAVGDHVKIACTEELMVFVNKSGETPVAATLGEVSVAPRGSKPEGMIVETTAISGKVLAIDAEKHKVTFEDPEGKKKTVKVRKSVDISALAVGDSVDAVLTESVIIEVTK
jgi:predicted RNA-binding protein